MKTAGAKAIDRISGNQAEEKGDLRVRNRLNPIHAEIQWPAEPPNAMQASRIVAWLTVAGTVVYGIMLAGLCFTGEGMGDGRSVFIISVALVQLILQAGTSAVSWRIGSRFAMLVLMSVFLLACIWVAFSYNSIQLCFFIVPAIFSMTAVTIEFRVSTKNSAG